MLSMKLLLTFSLLTGIVAEECTTDLGLDDFTDKVVVTNAGGAAGGVDAFVLVEFDHGRVTLVVPAGKSRTAVGIASTKYTVMVDALKSPSRERHRKELLDLRDDLMDISLSGMIQPMSLVPLWTELNNVQTALKQLDSETGAQGCTGKLKTVAPASVTLEWKRPLDGTDFWVLDCG